MNVRARLIGTVHTTLSLPCGEQNRQNPIRVKGRKSSQSEPNELPRRAEAAQCLQSCRGLCGRGLAADPGRINLVSNVRCAAVVDANLRRHPRNRISSGTGFLLGIRDYARRNCARIGNRTWQTDHASYWTEDCRDDRRARDLRRGFTYISSFARKIDNDASAERGGDSDSGEKYCSASI